MVNCIAPGFMKTNIHNKSLEKINKLPRHYRIYLQQKMKSKPDFQNVLGLINFILETKNMNLSGRTISANFDKWKSKNFLNTLKKNKNYLTLRRVNI